MTSKEYSDYLILNHGIVWNFKFKQKKKTNCKKLFSKKIIV